MQHQENQTENQQFTLYLEELAQNSFAALVSKFSITTAELTENSDSLSTVVKEHIEELAQFFGQSESEFMKKLDKKTQDHINGLATRLVERGLKVGVLSVLAATRRGAL